MGSLLAAVATVVVALLPDDFERLGARIAAALFIGVIVGVESRAGGSTIRRASLHGLLALSAAVAIASFKWFIGR